MNNKTDFEKLCRYIWQDSPHDFIAVRLNPVAVDDGQNTYRFAAPDNGDLTGTISITETGMISLARGLGYASVQIIKQRGKHGKFIIPDPEAIERDKLMDY
jgi:hypothetical protein